ncbi:DNA-binding SARP family transcriptional activator [Streptacidiphilus sp. MAP12-20]|uniref:AfsR/SARP family transcriptional regulator n=1 Tax=Streptacidiphilus sp. MAP12-20 TaxID=3156299 RepID=UPI0035124B10
MDIKVLGPLEAAEGEHSIVPSAGKPRQLLALLALNMRQMVPVVAMMEELWGSRPPRSATTTLQTYILQLRRSLSVALAGSGRQAKDVLVTRSAGYLLLAEPQDVDACRFDEFTVQGYAAFDAGDAEGASRLLRQALGLWRGPALIDLPRGSRLEVEAARLEETRRAALERRLDADLQLNRHHEILGELAGLTAQYPLHENLHAQFMLALHRCGMSARALEVYRRLCASLLDELGLEPSGPVQRLRHAVLASDPSLDPVNELRARVGFWTPSAVVPPPRFPVLDGGRGADARPRQLRGS